MAVREGIGRTRCPLCGVAVAQSRLKKHLRKAHAGDGLSRRPGLSAPEEAGKNARGRLLLRCSVCGTAVREDRYAAHVVAQHPPRLFAPSSREGRAKGPKYAEFSGIADEVLERRSREISRELKVLSPGFDDGRIGELVKERRRVTSELKSRKGSGLGAPPGRWYRGPGKVRFWRAGDGP